MVVSGPIEDDADSPFPEALAGGAARHRLPWLVLVNTDREGVTTATLSEWSGLSRSAVQRGLGELREAGVVEAFHDLERADARVAYWRLRSDADAALEALAEEGGL